jgi:hypothetical protein
VYKRQERAHDPDYFNNNFLFHGDKGFTVPQLFDFLDQAGLHFLTMVDRRGWHLTDWLTSPLPEPVAAFLANASPMAQLHAHDLIVGNHRLLDFWASPERTVVAPEPNEELWAQAWATLNPILRVEPLRDWLHQGLSTYAPQSLHPFLPQTVMAAEPVGWIAQLCLRCLWDCSLPVPVLVSQVMARLPATAEVPSVRRALQQLEKILAVFLTMP